MRKGMTVTVLTTIGYILFGLLGLSEVVPPSYATIVFPAAGFALISVLLFRYWALLGVFFGSVVLSAVSAEVHHHDFYLPLFCVLACATTLQAYVGSLLVRRYAPFPFDFYRSTLVLRFIVLAGLVSTLVNASLSVTVLYSVGRIGRDAVLGEWLSWWTGDFIGVLVIVPWFVVLFPSLFNSKIGRPLPLIMGLLLVIVVTVGLSFGVRHYELSQQTEEFSSNAELVDISLNSRLNNMEGILYGIMGLVRGSERVTVD